MKQTIDISPERVQPIAAAGVRFLNLETTLIPGNLKNQLAVLEVLLSGLSAGELLLAPPTPLPVESDVKTPGDKGGDPARKPAKPEMSSVDREALATAAATLPGLPKAGEGQSG